MNRWRGLCGKAETGQARAVRMFLQAKKEAAAAVSNSTPPSEAANPDYKRRNR